MAESNALAYTIRIIENYEMDVRDWMADGFRQAFAKAVCTVPRYSRLTRLPKAPSAAPRPSEAD